MCAAPAQRRNPRQARSKITVDAILEAATRVFSQKGFGRSSTNLIAETAGVSVGSLYQYFPDKQALLSALHERSLTNLMAAMTAACREDERAKLEGVLKKVIAAAAAHHRTNAPLERVFARHLSTVEEKPPRSSTRDFQDALKRLLRRHRDELRVKDEELALFVLKNLGRSLMEGSAFARPRDLENGKIARELLETALLFLTGRPRAANKRTSSKSRVASRKTTKRPLPRFELPKRAEG